MTALWLLAAQTRGTVKVATGSWLARVWSQFGDSGRIFAVSVLVLLVLAGLVVVWRRVGGGSRRAALWALTALGLMGVTALGLWARALPEPRGITFVLWHQIVRVGAVLSGTLALVGCMGLALPRVLDLIERRGFTSFVAARHVRSQKSGFLTVISLLSILGVAVSCAALCAVTSIMGGFGADLKQKILGNNAHVRIEAGQLGGFDHWREALDRTRLVPGVLAATPVAAGEVMASSSSHTAGVLVRGVEPETIGGVVDLVRNIELGQFAYLSQPERLLRIPPSEEIGLGLSGQPVLRGPDYGARLRGEDPNKPRSIDPNDVFPGIILGRELAKSLRVFVGEEVTLVSPLGDLGPMGLLPRSRRFRVAAIFYSGMYEFDATHAYIRLDVAQRFLDLGSKVTAIEVRADDAEHSGTISKACVAAVKRPELHVRDWKQLNRKLFGALLLEKIATFIILSSAIAVASFCIVCTLLLLVTEKTKEIAILKSLGASDRAIQWLFMTEGLIIGAIGTVFGVATGYSLALGMKSLGVRLSPDVYYVDHLPIEVNAGDYLLVAVASLVITAVATIYPAMAASRLRPIEGIRYE